MAYADKNIARQKCREYYYKNREVRLAKSREYSLSERGKFVHKIYRTKNREKLRALNTKWYREHPEFNKNKIAKIRINQPEKLRERDKKYRIIYKDQINAKHKVKNALKRGKIRRVSCEVCGSEKTHAHHEDYSKPLDVWFLCPIHHVGRHKRLREIKQIEASND
jgi:hypothetical protein